MFQRMGQGFARFVGVEMSGAAFAGLSTWVAAGRVDGSALVVESAQQVADLAGGAAERDVALPALAKWLGKQRHAVVAICAPFGLPAPLVQERSWVDFATAFAGRFQSPESFLADVGARGDGRFMVRVTDRVQAIRAGPHKRRVGFQTWANLKHVTGPLVAEGRAVAAPMQPASGRLPVLVETHVAAALRYRRVAPPFTGADDVSTQSRRAVLERFGELEGLQFATRTPWDVTVNERERDAMSAVIAATVAGRLAREPEALQDGIDEAAATEGRVYVS